VLCGWHNGTVPIFGKVHLNGPYIVTEPRALSKFQTEIVFAHSSTIALHILDEWYVSSNMVILLH